MHACHVTVDVIGFSAALTQKQRDQLQTFPCKHHTGDRAGFLYGIGWREYPTALPLSSSST